MGEDSPTHRPPGEAGDNGEDFETYMCEMHNEYDQQVSHDEELLEGLNFGVDTSSSDEDFDAAIQPFMVNGIASSGNNIDPFLSFDQSNMAGASQPTLPSGEGGAHTAQVTQEGGNMMSFHHASASRNAINHQSTPSTAKRTIERPPSHQMPPTGANYGVEAPDNSRPLGSISKSHAPAAQYGVQATYGQYIPQTYHFTTSSQPQTTISPQARGSYPPRRLQQLMGAVNGSVQHVNTSASMINPQVFTQIPAHAHPGASFNRNLYHHTSDSTPQTMYNNNTTRHDDQRFSLVRQCELCRSTFDAGFDPQRRRCEFCSTNSTVLMQQQAQPQEHGMQRYEPTGNNGEVAYDQLVRTNQSRLQWPGTSSNDFGVYPPQHAPSVANNVRLSDVEYERQSNDGSANNGAQEQALAGATSNNNLAAAINPHDIATLRRLFPSVQDAHNLLNQTPASACEQLNVPNDDWEDIRDNYLHYYAVALFAAIRVPIGEGTVTDSTTGAQDYFTKNHEKRGKEVAKLLETGELRERAMAQAMTAIGEVIRLHEIGITKASLQQSKQKANNLCPPEKEHKCSERIGKIIEHSRTNKYFALDVLKGNHLKLVLAPNGAEALKHTHSKTNAIRADKTKKAKTEKAEAEARVLQNAQSDPSDALTGPENQTAEDEDSQEEVAYEEDTQVLNPFPTQVAIQSGAMPSLTSTRSRKRKHGNVEDAEMEVEHEGDGGEENDDQPPKKRGKRGGA